MQQREFKGMPDRSRLGSLAIEYIQAIDDLEKQRRIVETIKKDLVAEFLASKDKIIRVDNFTVSYSHVETDKINVRNKQKN